MLKSVSTVTPLTKKEPIDLSKVEPKVLEAAQGMESMFLDYMFSVMRKTVPQNEFNLENSATRIYRGMLDSEIAKKAAAGNGLGLTELIVENMKSRGYNVYKNGEGQEAPLKGENHEGF